MLPNEKEKAALIASIDSTKFEESFKNYQVYRKTKHDFIYPWWKIRTTFWKGQYYFTYNCEIDGVKTPLKSIVRKINNKETHEFYNQNFERYFPLYDINTKAFYTNKIFNTENIDDTSIIVTIETPTNEEIELTINQNSNVSTLFGRYLSPHYSNHVEYLSKYKTLYIKYFSFYDGFGSKQIVYELAKYKNKKIDKVIIDERGNGGGSDLLWIQLMNAIWQNKKPVVKPKTCVLEDSKALAYLSDSNFSDSVQNESLLIYDNDITEYIGSVERVSELDAYESIKEFYDNLPNLNFKGDVFCLVDDVSFSAALSFASLKYYYENFYVVSDVAPYYGGFGLTPILYMLPSSKLMYRMTNNFDYLLYKDNFRVEPDISVDLDIDDLILQKNKKFRNHNSKKHLGRKNKYIQTILQRK